MEKLEYTKEVEDLLRKKVWGVLDGVFIKRYKGTSYIETLNIIDSNLDKLTLDYYALLNFIYCDVSGTVKAFGGNYYSEYQDFKDLYKDNSINKAQIIYEVIDAILELEQIGVQFTDIHARNIIVNSDSHMKLVDLDEAYSSFFRAKKSFLILDLIIECLILYDLNDTAWEYITPRHTLINIDLKNVLSKSFISAIKGREEENEIYSNLEGYVNELLDEEKASIIRKELITKYPHYF